MLTLTAHTHGVLAGPCTHCAGEQVVHFAECVVLPGYMQGKCTNCHYANDSQPCIMPADDDDNDDDDDDNDNDEDDNNDNDDDDNNAPLCPQTILPFPRSLLASNSILPLAGHSPGWSPSTILPMMMGRFQY